MKLNWVHSDETEDEFEAWTSNQIGHGVPTTIVRDGEAYKLVRNGYEMGAFGSLDRAKAVAEIGMSAQDLKDRESIITALRCAPLAAVWNAVVVLCDNDTRENMDTLRAAFTAASALMKKVGDPA